MTGGAETRMLLGGSISYGCAPHINKRYEREPSPRRRVSRTRLRTSGGRSHLANGHCPSVHGRGERIRTSGPCLPKTVLYQAELLPDRYARPQETSSGAGGARRL